MTDPSAANDSGLRPGLSPAKREQILAGARTVFLNDGFEGASMDRIARQAGVSKGTLYNYFASKESLFAALIHGKCIQDGSCAKDFGSVDAPPEVVLTRIGMQFVGHLLSPEELGLFRIVLSEASKFPHLGRTLEATGPAIGMGQLAAYLQSLNDWGLLAIPDPGLAAEQFISLCDAGTIRRVQLSVETPTRERIEAQVKSAVRLFLRGYAI